VYVARAYQCLMPNPVDLAKMEALFLSSIPRCIIVSFVTVHFAVHVFCLHQHVLVGKILASWSYHHSRRGQK